MLIRICFLVPWYYVDDGCQTDSGPDDFYGTYLPSTETFGVRCCSATECTTPYDASLQGLTYQDAVAICENEGLLVCSRNQILSEMCCGTGGQADNYPVWTSTLMTNGTIISCFQRDGWNN